MEHNAVHLIYKKIVGFTFETWLWWAVKFNIYHIGTALSGNTRAFTTCYCVEMALLLNHCGCQIFPPRAEIFKQASADAENQWLCSINYLDFWLFLSHLHLLFPHQSRTLSWLYFIFFMTGPMNRSPAENACFSVKTLTCAKGSS